MILTNRHIEAFLYRLALFLVRHRSIVIIGALAGVVFFAFHLSRIKLDTSIEGYLTENDPYLARYLQFRDQYGSDDLIIVALQAPHIFDRDTLLNLRRIHRLLAAQTPHLAGITSLDSIKVPRRENDRIVLDTFLPEDPKDWPTMEELAGRAVQNSMMSGRLLSPDATMALILLRIENKPAEKQVDLEQALLLSSTAASSPSSTMGRQALNNEQNTAVVTTVERIIAAEQQPGYRLFICGSPILKQVFRKAMMHDAVQLIILSLAVISGLLLLIFRRLSGVILPVLVVGPAVIVCISLMVILQRPIKAPTIILPSFLLAMGVGASIHLLTHFFRLQNQGQNSPKAAALALARSGLPIFFTSLTTAAGLISFAGAEVGPVADLGRFGALGIMLSFFFTIILLPPLLGMLPSGIPGKHFRKQGMVVNRVLSAIARFAVRNATWIAAISLLLFVIALSGANRITFSHNPLSWLPDKSPLRQGVEQLDRVMGGIIRIEVLLDTHHAGGALDPGLLQQVRTLQSELIGSRIGAVDVAAGFSLVNLLDDLDTLLDTDSRVGDPKHLSAQKLLLFEHVAPAVLAELTDLEYRSIRLTLVCPWIDAVAYGPFIKELETLLHKRFHETAEIAVTGMIPLLARTLDAAVRSTATSYLFAGVSITLLMILLCGVRLGLLGMIPNLLPIAMVLGYMGWRGIPLDMYTMLSGSIAVGLAVDDTMHFLHGFHHHIKLGMPVMESAERTIIAEGRAMLVTSLVLAAGALVCTISSLKHFFLFGVLTSSAIMLALIADFLLGPALMQLRYRSLPRLAPKVQAGAGSDPSPQEDSPWQH